MAQPILLGAMHPRDYHLLPDKAIYRHLNPQAWHLMREGRCEFEALPKAIVKARKGGGSVSGVEDCDASVDDRTVSTRGGGLLASIKKNTSAVSLLSSANDSYSSMSGTTRFNKHKESVFCFNDVTDVVEILTRQNHLQMRLDKEQRLKQSGLSLLADKGEDAGSAATVSGVAQRMLVDARKSLSSFATLQRVLAREDEMAQDLVTSGGSTSGGSSDKWKTCLDMPYRHLNRLSTRTNMIHMNIGDQGIARISHALPGNTFITEIVLANARITTKGLKHLCDAMMFLPNLKYLDLSQNCIDDVGASALADVLGNDTMMIGEASPVERITLMGNRITPAGANALLEALPISCVTYLK
jgi:hypothetical protein